MALGPAEEGERLGRVKVVDIVRRLNPAPMSKRRAH